LVFSIRLAPQVEEIIGRAADKAAGDLYGAYCAHGSSPTSPSYVAIDDACPGVDVVARVRTAAEAAHRYAAGHGR
jgi:hypothetical protein